MVQLKILCFSSDGVGHVNATLGLAKILSKAGHRVIVALSEKWQPLVTKSGFEFYRLKFEIVNVNDDQKSGEDDQNKNMEPYEWFEHMLKSFRQGPFGALEKFDDQDVRGYLNWCEAMLSFDKPLGEALETIKPDLLIVDFGIKLSSLAKCPIPWINLWSCSPVAYYRGILPPEGTGLPLDSPRELWDKYYKLFSEAFKPVRERVNKQLIELGVEPYSPDESIYLLKSHYMNIYIYPKALDYTDVAPRPEKCYRMDAVIRPPDDPKPFTLPDSLVCRPGALIYFSLGSMGSVDLDLMRKVIAIFAKLPHRFIVSKGPYHEKLNLPDNAWGDRYLNQIAVLPHVDLVITHGGNNTLTESLYFGKPVIVLPMFYDQLDNAQRIADKRLGVRLDTFNFTENEMVGAIEKLLNDSELYDKLEKISFDMQHNSTTDEIVRLIEKTAITKKSPE